MAHSVANETVVQENNKTELQGSSQPPSKPKRGQRRGGWIRRLLFVFLMLVVIAGLVLAAALLRMRLDAVLGEVDSLDNRLRQTQTDLVETQADLLDTQQDLKDLADESEAARAEFEQELTYGLLLQQAQNETTKAIVSLMLDDVGQARREMTSLRASLVSATELSSEADAATLSDLDGGAYQWRRSGFEHQHLCIAADIGSHLARAERTEY